MRPPQHRAAVALLGLPAWLYGGAVRLRNRHYDRPGASVQAGLPVVSVGNLTVGGTGKTPIVCWLAQLLLRDGRRPAVVSRGYGGRAGRGPLLVSEGSGPSCEAAECGDEPYLLARRLRGALVVVGSDRVAGAELARQRGADIVLLDDGFQHRRLHRDLDIVLLDAGNPFGNHRLLPAGALREPLGGLGRADLILITRCRREGNDAAVERVVRRHNRTAPLLRAGHRPDGFVGATGQRAPRPRRAVAFCGIGNPDSFRADLERLDVELVDFLPHPDHYRYTSSDLEALRRRAREGNGALVTTEKDLVRLGSLARSSGEPEPIALRIEAEVFGPEPVIDAVRGLLKGGDRR